MSLSPRVGSRNRVNEQNKRKTITTNDHHKHNITSEKERQWVRSINCWTDPKWMCSTRSTRPKPIVAKDCSTMKENSYLRVAVDAEPSSEHQHSLDATRREHPQSVKCRTNPYLSVSIGQLDEWGIVIMVSSDHRFEIRTKKSSFDRFDGFDGEIFLS